MVLLVMIKPSLLISLARKYCLMSLTFFSFRHGPLSACRNMQTRLKSGQELCISFQLPFEKYGSSLLTNVLPKYVTSGLSSSLQIVQLSSSQSTGFLELKSIICNNDYGSLVDIC